jgi:hypothetical protein
MTTKENKTKKIMGRPRKDDTTHIGFRITFKDRESLRRISKILGITVSKYMKDAVLKQLDKDLKEMEESSFTVTFQNGVELDGVLSEFFNLEKNNDVRCYTYKEDPKEKIIENENGFTLSQKMLVFLSNKGVRIAAIKPIK